MTEPIRERLHAAVATRLRTIVAGTVVYTDPAATVEYATTPKSVTRSLLSLDQYAEAQLPLLGVVRSSGSRFDWLTGTKVEHRVILDIWGYVQGDHQDVSGAVLASTWLERLWHDVLVCLRSDPRLGGLAVDCRPAPDRPMDTDDNAYEPQGWFCQPWEIRAHESLPVVAAA